LDDVPQPENKEADLMKTLISLAVAVTVAACGSDLSTAKLQGMNMDDSSTIIDGLEVEPATAGIEPGSFAVNVAGEIMLGANPCLAAGRAAELRVLEDTTTVSVVPTLIRAAGEEERACTKEYEPVMTRVAVTVHANLATVERVMIQNVGGIGQHLDVRQWFGKSPVVLHGVSVKPVLGGINPDAFAFQVSATVQAGANPCLARNQTVTLVTEEHNGILIVRADAMIIDAELVCTTEFEPVYKSIATTVRGMHSQTSSILLVNAEEEGRIVEVDMATAI
jgi:hypothetical protein